MQRGEIIEEFKNLREKTLAGIIESRDKNRKVIGIYCTYCPQELILAAGAVPVGLCGTRPDPIPAAEEALPRNLCPLIKSSYGYAVTDTCPFFSFADLVIGETTCDGKKKMFEIMQELKPVYIMQLPHLQNESSLKMWVEEIRDLKNFLEQKLEVEISDHKIKHYMKLVNKVKLRVKEVCDLNQADPPLLTGLELMTVSWSSGFYRGDVLQLLDQIKNAALFCKQPSIESKRPRILLTGCPVGRGSEKIIRLAEEEGGSIVAMESCGGYKNLSLYSDTSSDDPIAALAKKYFRIPCSCMTPNLYRMELLEQMMEDFTVEAVIDLTWQACHAYNIEAYEVKNLVKRKGIPYLHIETDYSTSDEEYLRLRIQALLEIV
ncbi:double-cubane-cluster-containing anaerobic reductase [Candidatus Contubernalis alkaliaceticus]|uniref:double-cubane-cluster-containing anaerobic reductase n=1 Tax=Candidatus Contubernalis alkaliaceticus TaxID=338645 RepID=UPI001F4BD4D9|nr:double-cubane-cluster-containing anaerobic reductase [Candidatus Contubernalis alkalaceticus]UNC90872.1 2-hydroxyacyl-CoA dehydratase [Candidatus Contubernalis alkalaceticus]